MLVINQLRGQWKVKARASEAAARAAPRSCSREYDEVDAGARPPRAQHRSRRARERRARRRGCVMVLWLAFGAIFATWNVFQSTGLDFRLVAVGALLPLALDPPFGGAVVRAHAHGRGRRVRGRDADHELGSRAPAPPPARAEPLDRLVHRARARGLVDAQGSVLVARVRCRPPGRAAAAAAGRSSWCSKCSALPLRGGCGRASACAIGSGAELFMRTGRLAIAEGV